MLQKTLHLNILKIYLEFVTVVNTSFLPFAVAENSLAGEVYVSDEEDYTSTAPPSGLHPTLTQTRGAAVSIGGTAAAAAAASGLSMASSAKTATQHTTSITQQAAQPQQLKSIAGVKDKSDVKLE